MKQQKQLTPQIDKQAAAYKPSAAELAAIDRYQARRAARASLKFTAADEDHFKIDHPDVSIASAVFMDAFGSADKAFCEGILNQLIKLTDIRYDFDGVVDLNFLVSMVNGLAPRDHLEAMLAAHMAAVQLMSMQMAHRFVRCNPTQEGPERAMNRLMRTSCALYETLNRYRSRGEQNITHVSVAQGGQAIVGNVTQAPREKVPQTAPPPSPCTATNGHSNSSADGRANGKRVPFNGKRVPFEERRM